MFHWRKDTIDLRFYPVCTVTILDLVPITRNTASALPIS